jgi:hypothetical protein
MNAGKRETRRGFQLAMDRWIKTGRAPSPSQFPRLAMNQLTLVGGLRFPKIPGVEPPLHKREAFRLDFSIEPPQMDGLFPTLAPQVDADGNDLGGIQMPEIKVPLASYTEMLSYTGSWIPFPLTREDRLTSGDPRASVQERYRNREAYLEKIDRAARSLVDSGCLLESDLP